MEPQEKDRKTDQSANGANHLRFPSPCPTWPAERITADLADHAEKNGRVPNGTEKEFFNRKERIERKNPKDSRRLRQFRVSQLPSSPLQAVSSSLPGDPYQSEMPHAKGATSAKDRMNPIFLGVLGDLGVRNELSF